jgi:gliding motility-associated-like protein
LLISGLAVPVASVSFKPNIDSVRFTQNIHGCSTTDFAGLGYTQTSAITNWSWNFGDGKTGASQNLSYTYPAFGTFQVTLVGTDINGCKDSMVMPVTLKDITISKRPDTSLCGSGSVKLSAGGGTTYNWSPATGLDNPNISDPVATPLASTKYEVTVTDALGCSKTDSVHITVNNLPAISKSKDTSICTKSSANLLALATGSGVTYQWSPASTLNNPNTFNPVASPTASTIYTVKATTTAGCSDEASISVDIDPAPVITKSKDSTICNNTTIPIFASGGSSYAWSPASSLDNPASASPVASPLTTTLYHVAITDIYSCVYRDSVKITVKDPAVFSVSPDYSVCAGKSRQLSASGGDTYQWSPASFLDNPQVSNPVALPGTSITYSVTITENTCLESATLSTKLTLLPAPDVRADKSNDITCSLGSARLSASGAQDFTWTPSNGLSNPGIYDPVASPVASTLYTVSGKDQNGCTGSDTVSVMVDFNGNSLYGLPNSFTPNGDGLNDCFGIRFWGQVEQLDFSIYNRFGERVFHTNNAADCWNGTYKGGAQNDGVFVYTIKATTVCGNIDKKGTVVLIR